MATKIVFYFSRYVVKYHVIANMFMERLWHFQVPNYPKEKAIYYKQRRSQKEI
jgi:hypothetical protein